MSEKYYGIRAFWDCQKLYTRTGRIIKTPIFFVEDWPSIPLDGELWYFNYLFIISS